MCACALVNVYLWACVCVCVCVAGLTQVETSACVCTDHNDSARQLSHHGGTVAKTHTHTYTYTHITPPPHLPYIQHSLPLRTLFPLSLIYSGQWHCHGNQQCFGECLFRECVSGDRWANTWDPLGFCKHLRGEEVKWGRMRRGSEGGTTGQQVDKQRSSGFSQHLTLNVHLRCPWCTACTGHQPVLSLHHVLYAPVLCVMLQLHWLASYLSIPKHFSLQLGWIILITIVCFCE